MPTPETQDGNCCVLSRMLDEAVGRMSGPIADEVAERVEAIIVNDRHPRTQELAGAIDSLVMAAYADTLNRKAAEEVRSRDMARTA